MKNQGTLREGLISSPEGSRNNPASLFPMQESEKGLTTAVTSGRRCLELSESLNRPLSLAKMLLVSSAWKMATHLTQYSLIWRMKATKRNNLLFQLVPLGRGTEEIEFGLLLTPSTVNIGLTENRIEKRTEYRNSIGRQYVPGCLLEQLQLIPTIGANEPKGSSQKRYRNSKDFRGAKTSEYMRTGKDDPIYLHPSFAEAMMGYPMGWTELKDSVTQ